MINLNDQILVNSVTALVPNLEHDDLTRLNMSHSQSRQTLILENPDLPNVMTGFEDVDHLNFKAYGHMKKIFSNNDIIVLKDEHNNYEIYKKLDFEKEVMKNSFDTNETICYNKSLKDMRYLRYGLNANCSFQPWFGYNIYDGIVISESFADRLVSEHYGEKEFIISNKEVPLSLVAGDYKPFPEPGDKIKKYDPILKIKRYTSSITDSYLRENEILSDYDCEIVNVKIFPNAWSMFDQKWDNFIRKYMFNIYKIVDGFKNDKQLFSVLLKSGYFSSKMIGMFRHNRHIFNGVLVKIKYKYKENIIIGDKLANRHGNKGVISKIEKDEDMPFVYNQLTGEYIQTDIIANFMGILTRMNLGQLYESELSQCLINVRKLYNTKDELLRFIEIYDNSNDNVIYKEYKEKWKNETDIDIMKNDLYIYQMPFQSVTYDRLKELKKYCCVPDQYEKFKYKNMEIKSPTSFGNIYWMKLCHLADEKIKSSHIGNLSLKYQTNLQGQRLGNMENWCLWSQDCDLLLREIDASADDLENKKNIIKQITQNGFANLPRKVRPTHAQKMFKGYLNMLGLDFNV